MFKDYSEDDKKEKPISCIITTLAGKSYNGEDNIIDALSNIVSKMKTHILDRNPYTFELEKWIPNPVNPAENFADRWALPNSKREKFFNDWLEQLKIDFVLLDTPYNRIQLSESLQKSFGNEPVKKTFSDIGNKMKNLTQSGNNYADRNLGLLGTATTGVSTENKIPPHKFYGDI